MNTWKVILATMIIFGAGVVTGGLLVRYAQRNGQHHPPRPNPGAKATQSVSPGGMRFEFLRRIEKELDLTPEQRERIDKIVKESQERNKKLMEPVAPRIKEELQRTREEFRQVLTPQQRARFDEMVKQQQQRPREPRKPSARDRAAQPAETNAPAPASP